MTSRGDREKHEEKITLLYALCSLRLAFQPKRDRLRSIVWESSTRADRIKR